MERATPYVARQIEDWEHQGMDSGLKITWERSATETFLEELSEREQSLPQLDKDSTPMLPIVRLVRPQAY